MGESGVFYTKGEFCFGCYVRVLVRFPVKVVERCVLVFNVPGVGNLLMFGNKQLDFIFK